MKREELKALLADAAARGGGAFMLNLAADDPIALLNRTLAAEKADALKAAVKDAAAEMKAEKIILLLPEDFNCNTNAFAIDGAEIVKAPRSLVLREVPAALHMLATGELRACPDERTYPSEGLEGKPVVIADAETLLAVEGRKFLILATADKRVFLEIPVGSAVGDILREQGLADSGKPVLLGGLTGRMVPAGTAVAVEDSPDFDLIRVYGPGECMAGAAAALFASAREESCQKCVLCREGSWHMMSIFGDVTGGKGTRESLPMIGDIGPLIARGAFCSFGRGMARLALSIVKSCRAELDAHIVRKQCPAGVCAAFNRKTYAIDPKKCSGNGDCVDECPEDAITFKKNFISMIDKDMCTGCGKCAEVCGEEAIVVYDGRMRVPDKPTRIGRFK